MTATLPLPDIADLLALLLRSTLLMGAAWAAAAALRLGGASAAARHMAWLLGIAALLALPLLWWLIPALRLPILPTGASTAAAALPSAAAAPHLFVPGGPAPTGAPAEAGWSLLLLAVYALGAAILLLRLIVGRRMLKRLWNDAGTVSDPAWQTLLSRLSGTMRLARPVELRISRGPAVPMTWGTLAPKLLLPAEASDWPPERRRLVLLHELAHVARRDSFSRSAASLACALYWFHPGAWLAARQMRMEQEHAADDRVLMAGGSPQAYALSLLHLARGAGARPRLDQAAAMAGMYQLERRLVSITGTAPRNRPGAFFHSSSALLAGLTTLLVAAGVPVSASTALPGLFREKGTATASPLMAAGKAKDPAARPGRAESRSSAPGGPDEEVERLAKDKASTASPPRGPASKRGDVATPPPEAAVASASGLTNPGEGPKREPPGYAQQLRTYGWELPRWNSRVEIGSPEASSQSARLVLPARPDSASKERIGRPKWARNVPRLVQGPPPTGSPVSRSEGPLMLSWSLEVVGK